MTLNQQEQHILSLLQHLPDFQQVRIALSILKKVDPSNVTIKGGNEDPWMTNELEDILNQRSAEIADGTVEPISGESFLTELKKLRS